MSQLVNENGLIHAMVILDKETQKLREAGQAFVRWYEASPLAKAREAKTALVTICTATYREILSVLFSQVPKRAELSLASPLELLANSLTSHAPPLEPNSKTGTGSS